MSPCPASRPRWTRARRVSRCRRSSVSPTVSPLPAPSDGSSIRSNSVTIHTMMKERPPIHAMHMPNVAPSFSNIGRRVGYCQPHPDREREAHRMNLPNIDSESRMGPRPVLLLSSSSSCTAGGRVAGRGLGSGWRGCLGANRSACFELRPPQFAGALASSATGDSTLSCSPSSMSPSW